MQRRHRGVRIALRDINKKGVEIDERQNRCNDDSLYTSSFRSYILTCNLVNNTVQYEINHKHD